MVVYHLPQIPGNFCWDVNGKRFFGLSHWKIRLNANSKKVSSPILLVGTFQIEIPLQFTSFWSFVLVSYMVLMVHVHVTGIQSSTARQSGSVRQMVNIAVRSYHSSQPKFPEFF